VTARATDQRSSDKLENLLRTARKRAGLSQRELAKRAGTAQSVVARIESGVTNPTVATLGHLLRTCGFVLDAQLAPDPVQDPHLFAEVNRILALTPEQRFDELANTSRFMIALGGTDH
jgi:transcriptional regulator with XRE-family HTH domain